MRGKATRRHSDTRRPDLPSLRLSSSPSLLSIVAPTSLALHGQPPSSSRDSARLQAHRSFRRLVAISSISSAISPRSARAHHLPSFPSCLSSASAPSPAPRHNHYLLCLPTQNPARPPSQGLHSPRSPPSSSSSSHSSPSSSHLRRARKTEEGGDRQKGQGDRSLLYQSRCRRGLPGVSLHLFRVEKMK